jgi:DNA polymerase-3 subunit alpha
MKNSFSHLRVSSEYSITQGLLTINQIVDSAVKHSVPSVALTDRSNMFGLVKFFNKCESSGIKPISGSSIRVAFEEDEQSHELLCLAKTNKGHKNLMKIISSAHNNYNYQTPIIDFKDLEYLKDEIIVISGGKDSHIFDLLKRHKIDEAEKRVDKFLTAFKDDFVLEVQKTNRADEYDYFSNIAPLSSKKGVPLIATNDVLFAKSSDFDTHETKVCINTGKTLNDPNREKIFSQEQYFKSPEQMTELFKGFDELIDNTNEISKNVMYQSIPKNIFYQNIQYPRSTTLTLFL